MVHAADDGAFAGKDAAEQVHEGNIKQWIEYYEGQRKVAPAKVSKDRDSKPASAADVEGDRSEVPVQRSK
jgi:hypothetical protein